MLINLDHLLMSILSDQLLTAFLWRGWFSLLLLLLLLLSRFSRVRLCATPQMEAHQAPPSLGLSRQEHWSGLPFPSPMQESEKWTWSRSVVPDSLRAHGLQPTRLLRPWGFSRQEDWSGVPLPSPTTVLYMYVKYISLQSNSQRRFKTTKKSLWWNSYENFNTGNWAL